MPCCTRYCRADPRRLTPALADEGMWTYDNFPAATVREKYGVDINAAWLDACG